MPEKKGRGSAKKRKSDADMLAEGLLQFCLNFVIAVRNHFFVAVPLPTLLIIAVF